jgi:hypothetical protein
MNRTEARDPSCPNLVCGQTSGRFAVTTTGRHLWGVAIARPSYPGIFVLTARPGSVYIERPLLVLLRLSGHAQACSSRLAPSFISRGEGLQFMQTRRKTRLSQFAVGQPACIV